MQIISVYGHYEVYAPDGRFLYSADTWSEVEEEGRVWEEEHIA